ncbi:MAG: PIG-L family deacetylase [Opitutales bacterium]|nr:PIG-L family deacetylase [Opitutales bacterium]
MQTLALHHPSADCFVPDGSSLSLALSRTTHLCVAAHQDDIEIFAYHGISNCFRSEQKWFTGVVLTDGKGSPRSGDYAGVDDIRMQQIRRQEQLTAASIGQYSAMLQLGYSSSELKQPPATPVVEDLQAILRATQPQVLYVHNPADRHDTHVAALLRTLAAVTTLPLEQRPQKLYAGEVWRSLDWLIESPAKVALPVADHPALAAALIGVFDSQISGGKRYDLATVGRRLANATYSGSHHTDECAALSWVLDLSVLLQEHAPSLMQLIATELDAFKDDVIQRLRRLT